MTTASSTGTGTAISVRRGRKSSRTAGRKGVYKTLVSSGKSGNKYVFVIPVKEELDLKKAAKAVGEKSIEMLKQKDLLPTTGYVHGGCSPIGMKKFFTTTLHETAKTQSNT